MALSSPIISHVCIIGLGLIGCSWIKALRSQGAVTSVIGFDSNLDSMEKAVELGIIDEYASSAKEAVKNADLVILSVPILATKRILLEIKDSLSSDTIVTDVGSVKGQLIADMDEVFGSYQSNFILGHPIAGSEKSGVTAADESLFKNHDVILTPLEKTNPQALSIVKQLWQVAGARVELMGVKQHDSILAATSHLPHLLAYSLVDTLAHKHENKEIFNYAAGGFRDFTRIAASSPQMWHDIFTANKEAVIDALDLFSEDLSLLRQHIEAEDSEAMMKVFTQAKIARDHFSEILARKEKS